MRLVAEFPLTVPDDIPITRVQAYLTDALSIGSEQLDEDPENEMPGILGEITIRETG